MTRDELLPVFEAMERYGGSFVKHLSVAMRHADSNNLKKLTDAFPDVIEHYRKHFTKPTPTPI